MGAPAIAGCAAAMVPMIRATDTGSAIPSLVARSASDTSPEAA
jgi:hypothetical protein